MQALTVPFADLRAQHASLNGAVEAAIRTVLDDSAFIGGINNPHVLKFETAFAEYLGGSHCVTCGNGTDAIEMILLALGIGPGDEVIVPAMSWISTAEAVSNVGATPVFVDTQRDQCAIDVSAIDAACTAASKAIIVVHLYGRAADMDCVMAVAEQRGLRVIEDCAQAHGATFRGRVVGTIGDASSYSFFPSKNLGAIGDAGAVVTPSAEIADRVRLIANHGQRKKNEHLMIGRNSRLDGLQAAVLSAKLPHVARWNAARRAHARVMIDGLQGVGDLSLPSIEADRDHVFHVFAVRTAQRDALAAHLKARGIATAIHYPTPMPCSATYAGSAGVRGAYPSASAQGRELLSLPLYPEMMERHIDAVVCAVRDFFEGASSLRV